MFKRLENLILLQEHLTLTDEQDLTDGKIMRTIFIHVKASYILAFLRN